MKDNIELNTARDFGDIISDSFVLLMQNIKGLLNAYIVIGGLFIFSGIIISIFYQSQYADEGASAFFSFAGLLSMLFGLLNYTALLLTGLSYFALYKDKGNQAPTVSEVWTYFRFYFFRVFFAQLLLTVALVIAFFLCFFPGIYLIPVCSLVIPIMVIENTNLEYAVRRAFTILKENWWLVFGSILLVTIIAGLAFLVCLLPALLFYGSSAWLTGKSLDSTFNVIEAVITHITQVLWMLPIITATLLYFTLTEQKDAGSLINRIKMFGQRNTTTDQSSFEQY